jgi:DNA-directed RNA polymerase subunit H (RpoH/RPB5)
MGQLRVNEDEQDADWALQHGIISHDEYTNILSKAGLAPSELEFM